MYLVRVSFTNRHGAQYHWDFNVETDDYAEACDEAVLTFWDGLTFEERWCGLHFGRLGASVPAA